MLRQRVLGPLAGTTKALSEVLIGALRIKVNTSRVIFRRHLGFLVLIYCIYMALFTFNDVL